MSSISQYTFTSTFNTDSLTTRQAKEMGVTTTLISTADSDGDGVLSITEILANTDLCDELMATMAMTTTTTQQEQQGQMQPPPPPPPNGAEGTEATTSLSLEA